MPNLVECNLIEHHQTRVFLGDRVEEAGAEEVLAASGQGPECFLSHLYLRSISRVGLLALWIQAAV